MIAIGGTHYCRPDREAIEVYGNVIYHEGMRTWNTLRLARKIVEEFSQLHDRRTPVGYRAVLPRGAKKMEELFAKIKKGELPTPLLLFFTRQDE